MIHKADLDLIDRYLNRLDWQVRENNTTRQTLFRDYMTSVSSSSLKHRKANW